MDHDVLDTRRGIYSPRTRVRGYRYRSWRGGISDSEDTLRGIAPFTTKGPHHACDIMIGRVFYSTIQGIWEFPTWRTAWHLHLGELLQRDINTLLKNG